MEIVDRPGQRIDVAAPCATLGPISRLKEAFNQFSMGNKFGATELMPDLREPPDLVAS
jgi:hypothetical protein